MSAKGAQSRKKWLRWYLAAISVLAVLAAGAWWWQSRPGYEVEAGFATVEDAFRARQSGIMTEVTGTVARILLDDKDDLRNQKFIIRLPNDQSVLVVHDQKAGGRVPLSVGDTVLVRGEYMWTETGGTLRNTQRDFSQRRLHGWIDHEGNRYQ
jgi:hypothetical protein